MTSMFYIHFNIFEIKVQPHLAAFCEILASPLSEHHNFNLLYWILFCKNKRLKLDIRVIHPPEAVIHQILISRERF